MGLWLQDQRRTWRRTRKRWMLSVSVPITACVLLPLLFLDLIHLLSPHPGDREQGKCVCASSQEAMSNNSNPIILQENLATMHTSPGKRTCCVPLSCQPPFFLRRIPSSRNTLGWPWQGADEDPMCMREAQVAEETGTCLYRIAAANDLTCKMKTPAFPTPRTCTVTDPEMS